MTLLPSLRSAPDASALAGRGVALALCVGVVALLGGSATTSLSPAPGDLTLPGQPDAAVDSVSGVIVVAQADAWAGDYAVSDAVQPVFVTIDNGSAVPLRVRYGDFALISPDGRRYSALPPFAVEGEMASPLLAGGYAPFDAVSFDAEGFEVAPYFAPLYPSLGVYDDPYDFYDPAYYDLYYQDLVDAIEPTVEMLSLALPEGVISPGGRVTGYLYFQLVDPGVPSVTFREDLVGVGTGAFGEVSIPFTVTTTK